MTFSRTKHHAMARIRDKDEATKALATATLDVPLHPTGPPLMALLVHLPGRVFVRGALSPHDEPLQDAEQTVTIELSGTAKLLDQIDVTTEAWRAGGLAIRLCLNASSRLLERTSKALTLHRGSQMHPRHRKESTRAAGDEAEDEDDNDNTENGLGSLLVEITVPRPLSYMESTAETVVDQTALSTKESSQVGLAALNSSIIVVVTQPNWTMESMSLSSYGHGLVQVDAPWIQVKTSVQLKASGPHAVVAVAATRLDANVMEATANEAGSVYLAGRNVTVGCLKTTMAGQGVISFVGNGSCTNHAVTMLSSGEVFAGALQCYDTTVYSVGSGHVVVDGGHSLTATTIGTGRLSYVRKLPDVVTHVGFAPRFGVHLYQEGDDAGPLTWELLPVPPHRPKPAVAAPFALDMQALPTILTLAIDAEVLVGIALVMAVPLVLWTFMRRRLYRRIA